MVNHLSHTPAVPGAGVAAPGPSTTPVSTRATMVAVVAALLCVLWIHPGAAAASGFDAPRQHVDWRSTVAEPQSFRALLGKVHGDGRVRAIAALRVAWTVPGRLSDNARRQQEQRVSAARKALLASIGTLSYRVVHTYGSMPFVALELSAPALAAVQRSGLVAQIGEDHLNRPALGQSGPLVEATETTSLGFTGAGQTIAVIDTGVDAGHPFFGGRVLPGACFTTYNACPNGGSVDLGAGAAAPCTYTPNTDGCQHGTHVAGIAAGANGGLGGVPFSGVAPGADIMPIQVFSPVSGAVCQSPTGPIDDPCPRAFDSDVLYGLWFVAETADTYSYAAVNVSIGGATYSSPCTGSLTSDLWAYELVIATLWKQGIPTVVASGNDGFKNKIAAPACVPGAISVGNTTKADTVHPTSNSAPFLTLLAPGTNVVSSDSGTYLPRGGTSMAAPHVAGAFAVLRDRFPGADPADLLAAMQTSGQPITDTNGVTTPRLRLLNAMVILKDTGLATSYEKVLTGGKIVSQGTGLGYESGGTITIAGVPTLATVTRAYLYTMMVGGPDGDGLLKVNGSAVDLELVGASHDPCTGIASDGAARVYRSDVTGLVNGNGAYAIDGLVGTGLAEGASLVLVLTNPVSSVSRQVVINDGAMTLSQGATGATSFMLQKPLSLPELHVGIGAATAGTGNAMTLDGNSAFQPTAFFGSDGATWDDRTVYLKEAQGTANPKNSLTAGTDCLAWAYSAVTSG